MLDTVRRRPYLLALALAVLVVGWLAFRPELLFVNKTVNDPFPVATAAHHASSVTKGIQ